MNSNNKLSRLRTENGVLKGGFATLSINQLEKIKAGKVAPKETNYVLCHATNGYCPGK
jgi:hypothetical protein